MRRNTNWALTYCGTVRQLRVDLAAAEDAARLEADIRADQDRLAGMPVIPARADQQIDSLAAITGYAAAFLLALTTIFFAALIETASALGPVIVANGARYAQDRPEAPPVAPVAEAVAMTVEPPMGSFEDGFSRWASASIIQDSGSKTSTPAAYGHFVDWCRFNGPYATASAPVFGRVFGAHAKSLGAIQGRTGSVGTTWAGITIRNAGNVLRLPSAAQ